MHRCWMGLTTDKTCEELTSSEVYTNFLAIFSLCLYCFHSIEVGCYLVRLILSIVNSYILGIANHILVFICVFPPSLMGRTQRKYFLYHYVAQQKEKFIK